MRFMRAVLVLGIVAILAVAIGVAGYAYGEKVDPPPQGEGRHVEGPREVDAPPGRPGVRMQEMREEAAERLRQVAKTVEQVKNAPSVAAATQELDRISHELDEMADKVGGRVQEWGGQLRERMRQYMEGGPGERAVERGPAERQEWRRIVTSPIDASLAAVQGIHEMAKDDPKAGAAALQSLLEKTEVLPVRTAIHLSLSDVLKKTGDKEGALQQLQAVVVENAQHMPKGSEGHAGRMPWRPAEPQPPEAGE